MIETYLGSPVYFDNIQNSNFFILFEGGEGEVFLFFTSDLIGATIGCGLPPWHFLIDTLGVQTLDAVPPLVTFLLGTGGMISDDDDDGILGVGGVTCGDEGGVTCGAIPSVGVGALEVEGEGTCDGIPGVGVGMVK